MSMKKQCYLISGFQTTRQEMAEKHPDAWQQLLDSEPYGITAVMGEGSSAVLVGREIASAGDYSEDEEEPVVIDWPDKAEVIAALSLLGLEPSRIDTYFYVTWQ